MHTFAIQFHHEYGSSTHASYKGYGWNKTKSLGPPHRNTIIDVGVLRCGTIWSGKGATAPFTTSPVTTENFLPRRLPR